MSTQWTDEDPGAGSTASLENLASKFSSMSAELEMGRGDVANSLEVFSDYWSGLAASAAQERVSAIQVRAETLEEAAAAAKRALNAYIDELEAIQPLANDQIAIREHAKEQVREIAFELSALPVTGDHFQDTEKRNDLEMRLREARDSEEHAVGRVLDLAKRRQAGDHALLETLRAVLADGWDLPTGAFPSDRSWEQQVFYEYDMGHSLGVSTDEYTAQELMDLFKKHPTEIFPFVVTGDSAEFRDGAVFELSETLFFFKGGIDTGRVVVNTTDTSVKFTVISDNYFDGPGSTIEFSIVEKGGQFALRKVANAEKAQAGVAQLAPGGAYLSWSLQAADFKNVIRKYGAGNQ